MKPADFSDYFTSLGIAKPIFDRIGILYDRALVLVPNFDLEQVMVNDYIESDGTRRYSDLRLYGKEYTFVMPDFVNSDTILVNFNVRDLLSIRVESTDYDFKKATEKSRLHATTLYEFGGKGDLIAAKENCDHLIQVIEKVYKPMMKQ